ncbi:hypothetical protein ACIP88_09960 [Streptomyces uncialis]|uniref:hypothetical protein n=1 Tax=Streptomyces uncialis TaxID=1048205 RepID=UPI003821ECCC
MEGNFCPRLILAELRSVKYETDICIRSETRSYHGSYHPRRLSGHDAQSGDTDFPADPDAPIHGFPELPPMGGLTSEFTGFAGIYFAHAFARQGTSAHFGWEFGNAL